MLITLSFWGCNHEHRKTATNQEALKKTSVSDSIIVGNYIYDESGPDQITLSVSKKHNRYFYSLKTKVRSITGTVSVMKYPDENIYLHLNGIKWERNQCNSVDEDNDEEEQATDSVAGVVKKNIPPTEIELLVDENELVLQNGLNSFEFVPLPECCDYYLHFAKK